MTAACAGLSLLSPFLSAHLSSMSLTRLATGWGKLYNRHETSLVPLLFRAAFAWHTHHQAPSGDWAQRDRGSQQQTALAERSQGSRGKALAHSLTRDGGWHWLETAIPSSFLPCWLYPDPPCPKGLATAFLMDAAQMPHHSPGHRFTHCLTRLPTWTDVWQVTVYGQVTLPTHRPMPGPGSPICLGFPASLRSQTRSWAPTDCFQHISVPGPRDTLPGPVATSVPNPSRTDHSQDAEGGRSRSQFGLLQLSA